MLSYIGSPSPQKSINIFFGLFSIFLVTFITSPLIGLEGLITSLSFGDYHYPSTIGLFE